MILINKNYYFLQEKNIHLKGFFSNSERVGNNNKSTVSSSLVPTSQTSTRSSLAATTQTSNEASSVSSNPFHNYNNNDNQSNSFVNSTKYFLFNKTVFCIACYVKENFKKEICFDNHILLYVILSTDKESYIINYQVHLTAWTLLMYNLSISYRNVFVKERFSSTVLIFFT